MKKTIIKRLGQMVVVLFGISFITFFLTYLAPGDPATAMYESMGITPTQEVLEQTRENMGLNRSFAEQYAAWLTGCLQGDFGESFSKNAPVLELLIKRLPATFRLSLLSLLFMTVVSVPLGIFSAVKSDRIPDFLIRGFTFIGISLPGFVVGLMLLYFLGLKLHLLPIANNSTGFQQMLLPALTLAFAMASKYTRQVRTAVLEELSQDYVVGAKARGLSRSMILWKHVLVNALLPLITMFGLSFGSLLGGTAVVEIIFNYPGLGILAVSAVQNRDYPLIQGFVLWIAFIYMLVNLVVDISYDLIDPRIREEK
ncbi:MAG: nickel ABC transporter permease [Lachnospiraceae bacterium]|nr:nickel ABC transporter permease [Lachnospiraceae bacterium]